MHPYRLVPYALALILFSSFALAQQPDPFANAEFGDISQLTGLHRVFVTTTDLKIRDSIVEELKKYQGLAVVDRIEQSDFVLSFQGKYTSRKSILGRSTDFYQSQLVASFTVTNDPQGRPRQRILWHANLTGKDVAARATRQFTSDLKKARGEK